MEPTREYLVVIDLNSVQMVVEAPTREDAIRRAVDKAEECLDSYDLLRDCFAWVCEPRGAEAVIYWDDPNETENVYISFGEEIYYDGDVVQDSYGVPDNSIFFYGSPDDYESYRDGLEGWTLLEWEVVHHV
jgi:hypothetical protein